MGRRRFLAVLAGIPAIRIVTPRAATVRRLLNVHAPSVNVRDFGARGDGTSDDTAAFARAIASLGSAGGTVTVPDGTYRIDPLKSVVLTSHVSLELSSAATLSAIPVVANKSAIISVVDATDVSIKGGTLIGERNGHLGVGGEWGMGIDVRGGQQITISGVRIRDCWGDGIYIGSSDRLGESRNVTIRGCVSSGNRRQGLSVTGCIEGLIEDCEFSNTSGTAPQSGVDLEPNGKRAVTKLVLRRCRVSNNAGSGIVLSGATVTEVTLDGNTCDLNRHKGIAIGRASNCTVMNNIVTKNETNGITLSRASHNRLISNTVVDNGQSRSGRWDDVLLDNGSSYNTISGNTFFTADRPGNNPRSNIRIGAPTCVGNTVTENRTGPGRARDRAISDLGRESIIGTR